MCCKNAIFKLADLLGEQRRFAPAR